MCLTSSGSSVPAAQATTHQYLALHSTIVTTTKSIFYYIKLKAVCLSVCLTVKPISQPCLQLLKWGLLEMKAESSGTSKYIYKSKHAGIHPRECIEANGVS